MPFYQLSKENLWLVYIDDIVWVSPDQTRINKVLDLLKEELEMTIEGDVKSFLSIKYNHLLAGEIMIFQHGLIGRVLKSTGLQDSNPDQMPASQKALGTDKEGTEFAEQWSYSSVVGMLLYLAANSQPEIAYTVHQCA